MNLSRRSFLSTSATSAALGITAPNLLLGQTKGANDRLRVAVMGLKRGMGHVKAFQAIPNVEIAGLCEVDHNRLSAAAKWVNEKQEKPAAQFTDIRKLLEDPDIDAISIAAPNFWHAPATILACRAGKHVYVEKPGSYNGDEAERMVKIAAETGRQVQMGTQRRSYPAFIEGIQKLHEGVIGDLRFARCWYTNSRPPIGVGKVATPPEHLDWALWQGPLPERPYKDNLVHYNWHWLWHYGGGEMANNGVHALDIARWALGVDIPTRVTCGGGRYHFEDDQETPDTIDAFFDYGKVGITWGSSSHHRRKPETLGFVRIYGEGGMMEFNHKNYKVFDEAGKEVAVNTENASDVPHFTNFADAIREGTPLNQPIDDAQISTLLCHYANMAYRSSGTVQVDPATRGVIDQPAATAYWARDGYRKGWNV